MECSEKDMYCEKEGKFGRRYEDQEAILQRNNQFFGHLWGHFKDEVLKACDEMCEKMRLRRSKGDTW